MRDRKDRRQEDRKEEEKKVVTDELTEGGQRNRHKNQALKMLITDRVTGIKQSH